jgi:hypothetical protein
MSRSNITKRVIQESQEIVERQRIGHKEPTDHLKIKSKEPLPKASPELGPPTPHGKEAVGVGYQLAKRKKKRGGSTYA